MNKIFRIGITIGTYALAFALPVVALAAVGFYSTLQLSGPKPAALASAETGASAPRTKSYDPALPTVAIVLGDHQTEITDFLIPYELFSATGAYNVYAVAPERKMSTLSGGLEVLPDFSYAYLDTLLGRSPDVVLIPAIPDVTSPQNRTVLGWIKQQSARGSFIFSICVGAEAFAATGLLDGRTATTHWGDIDRIEKQYPAVNWVRGVRYVDGGDYMTSAGISSGIDAVLHFIAQHNGDALAQSVAQQMHYPSYAFVDDPRVEQASLDAALMLTGLINIAFHPQHSDAGVLLYDGVGELELAATFDTYAASYTTRLLSVAQTRRLITTRHGLQLAPRWGFNDVPSLDRLIVPGTAAPQLGETSLVAWQTEGKAEVFYLHSGTPEDFVFDAPLRDLARRENIPTAVLAAQRLEYRPGMVQDSGAPWPVLGTLLPLLVGLAGLVTAWAVRKGWRSRSQPRGARAAVQPSA